MALRWSAELFSVNGYKHRAPLEHFASASKDLHKSPTFRAA
jgi:hypothetical protein